MTTCAASRPTSDWREWRRPRAWGLKERCWTQRAIARALGVTEGAVSQWCERARENGAQALRRCVARGSAPTLFQSERLLLGLNCLEAGQAQAVHDHADQDKFYFVVEAKRRDAAGDRNGVHLRREGRR